MRRIEHAHRDLCAISCYVGPDRARSVCQCSVVTLSERLCRCTDRRHYTLPCFLSPLMKCHSVLSVLSLCLGCSLSFPQHFSISHIAWSLSFILNWPHICVHVPALSFSTLTQNILTLYFFIFPFYPYLFALFNYTHALVLKLAEVECAQPALLT